MWNISTNAFCFYLPTTFQKQWNNAHCFNTHKEILQEFDVVLAAAKAGLEEILEILTLQCEESTKLCMVISE